ncbi:response regulator transcription factor [Dyella sp. C11]|uniref:response regulator transcription factor n=1 Tax=Dyella sp. C11 TaxID=2126991 RepID=UPI000D64F126|nr:response regulator transcription factor [Dyella sp. C11]
MSHAIGLGPTLIVDDDASMLDRLTALLKTVEGTPPPLCARSVAEARRVLSDTPVLYTALIDLGLPDGNGVDIIAQLHNQRPEVNCVVISAWEEEATVLSALRAGACGYLLKERDDDELRMALQSISRGGASIDPFVARGILALISATTDITPPPSSGTETTGIDRMSQRETEILQLVARGHSNREIAGLTGLSRLTVESYTKSIYRKLAVSSRTAAVFEARMRGLLR